MNFIKNGFNFTINYNKELTITCEKDFYKWQTILDVNFISEIKADLVTFKFTNVIIYDIFQKYTINKKLDKNIELLFPKNYKESEDLIIQIKINLFESINTNIILKWVNVNKIDRLEKIIHIQNLRISALEKNLETDEDEENTFNEFDVKNTELISSKDDYVKILKQDYDKKCNSELLDLLVIQNLEINELKEKVETLNKIVNTNILQNKKIMCGILTPTLENIYYEKWTNGQDIASYYIKIDFSHLNLTKPPIILVSKFGYSSERGYPFDLFNYKNLTNTSVSFSLQSYGKPDDFNEVIKQFNYHLRHYNTDSYYAIISNE